MKKKIIIIILFILLTIPCNIEAKSINDTIPLIADVNSCEGIDKSLFGDVNDPTSTAWLIQKILNYMKVLGPTIAVVFGSIDMVKAVITSDEENMKKATSKFMTRILAAVALFFVPLATSILLSIFGLTADSSKCGLK